MGSTPLWVRQSASLAFFAKILAGHRPEHPDQRLWPASSEQDACVRAGPHKQGTNQRCNAAKIKGLLAPVRTNHDAFCKYNLVVNMVFAQAPFDAVNG